MDPIINIVTRTHNRPKFFDNCVKSITQQSYQNIRHIVTYQTEEDYEYLKGYTHNITLVKVPNVKKDPAKFTTIYDNVRADHAPYNAHFNHAYNVINEGWILHVDDDDMLLYSNAIEYIVQNIKSYNIDNILHLWYADFKEYKVPHTPVMEAYKHGHEFVRGNVSTIGLCFHSNYKKIANWHEWALGDWDVYQKLDKLIPNRNCMDVTLTGIQTYPGKGKAEDIVT